MPDLAAAAELPLPAAAPDPMVPLPWRLERRRRETADTFTLELAPAGGGGALRFLPGQFNMLYLFGVGECAISISGDPTRPGPAIHTVRAVGAVTRGLCGLKRGRTVGLRGPFGNPWPLGAARGNDIVIVAGGIGLAPLRPAIYQLLAERPQFGRVVILYGARGPEDLLYRRELERWGGRFDVDVLVTVDRAGGGWYGHVGVVPELVRRAGCDPLNTVALTCGPEIMMRHAARALIERGVDPGNIYVSMEHNMKCAIGFCGHCQLGPEFVCRDGPVFPLPRIAPLWEVREL